jgi:hypothetical protein
VPYFADAGSATLALDANKPDQHLNYILESWWPQNQSPDGSTGRRGSGDGHLDILPKSKSVIEVCARA